MSLWARFDTGEMFSAEWVNYSAVPIGRLYKPSAELCWESPYSAATGYGAWVETSTGPLGVKCDSVSSATWYVRASMMSSGETYTGADSISSGYMGITHMVHQTGNNIVVGGELDGRTLSALMSKGKTSEGEVYVVSTSNSVETLLASSEASAQAHLLSTSAVDPGTVGGLTGSSAQTLQSQLGTFTSLWSNSDSVSTAEMHGLVSQRCPSSTSAAYIAIGCRKARQTGFTIAPDLEKEQSISLQRLSTTSSDLQLLLVCALLYCIC